MAQDSEKWIEIARAGRFQDSSGAWHDFSQSRLEKIAAGYDPGKREAPLVLGHPATNGPAHGWIKSLKTLGQKLMAKTVCVTAETKQAVDNGLYKYVSMSLYRDGGLRHVGLLGATPPAIDGLAPVAFADDDAAITINFSLPEDEALNEPQPKGNQMTIEELSRQVGELTAKLEAADREKEEALKQAAALQAELNSLKDKGEKTEDVQAELDDLKKEHDETVAEFAAYRDRREVAALAARVSSLVKDGKVGPAEKTAVTKTALALHQANKSKALNFAAGSDNPLEVYFKSLDSRKAAGIFQNFSAPENGGGKSAAQPKPLSAKL